MAKTTAELIMESETRVSYGEVPDRLSESELVDLSWQMQPDQFLFRAMGDYRFHYRRGAGITVHRGANADAADEALWLNGTVYAAVASMNGLVPVHASAVAAGGSVFAFSGPAGSGKSTLTAALGKHGFRMFSDDTLLLDLSDPERVVCLPGHKRLKLTPEAIELVETIPEEKVSKLVDKFYARPPAGEVRTALPLSELIFLEEGSDLSINPVSGSDRFIYLQDDHYTGALLASARAFDRRGLFVHLTTMARRIKMARFVRPRDLCRFKEGVEIVTRHIADNTSRETIAAE